MEPAAIGARVEGAGRLRQRDAADLLAALEVDDDDGNVVLWRAGDLGYALVSDVDARELDTLAARVSPAFRPAS